MKRNYAAIKKKMKVTANNTINTIKSYKLMCYFNHSMAYSYNVRGEKCLEYPFTCTH